MGSIPLSLSGPGALGNGATSVSLVRSCATTPFLFRITQFSIRPIRVSIAMELRTGFPTVLSPRYTAMSTSG